MVKQLLTEHPSGLNHLKHCLAENAKATQYLNNNNNKPERNVNEFEQVPIKEKESWLPLQKFSLLPQNNNEDDDDDDDNNNNKKNIETNKAEEQMDIKQERKKKS